MITEDYRGVSIVGGCDDVLLSLCCNRIPNLRMAVMQCDHQNHDNYDDDEENEAM